MKMLPQEMIMEIFLFCPSKELFAMIYNKKAALAELEGLRNTVEKLYIFWMLGDDRIDLMGLLDLSLRTDSNLFYNIIDGQTNQKILNKCANLAAEYNREKQFKCLILGFEDEYGDVIAADNYYEIASSAIHGGEIHTIVTEIIRRLHS